MEKDRLSSNRCYSIWIVHFAINNGIYFPLLEESNNDPFCTKLVMCIDHDTEIGPFVHHSRFILLLE